MRVATKSHLPPSLPVVGFCLQPRPHRHPPPHPRLPHRIHIDHQNIQVIEILNLAKFNSGQVFSEKIN